MEEDVEKQTELLNELIKERPEITYLTEIGITLQDYISAKVLLDENENDPFSNALYTNYATCLFFTVADRTREMMSFIQ
jgi:enamine deaminase RidA (YjgF/YER057c/UK114 family)